MNGGEMPCVPYGGEESTSTSDVPYGFDIPDDYDAYQYGICSPAGPEVAASYTTVPAASQVSSNGTAPRPPRFLSRSGMRQICIAVEYVCRLVDSLTSLPLSTASQVSCTGAVPKIINSGIGGGVRAELI
ncbi:hypothetical protein JHW43_000660 [Diplocarpon mali]|nr:hypothetical protein JHW43_000660 [Diplocarpon mali]